MDPQYAPLSNLKVAAMSDPTLALPLIKNNLRKYLGCALALAVLLGSVPFGLFLLGACTGRGIPISGDALQSAALYGDSFGFLNGIVSGLAFAALVLTLLMQREELELQRQELASTREELARTANAQEKTEFHLRLSTYLDTLESLRSATLKDSSEGSMRGAVAFVASQVTTASLLGIHRDIQIGREPSFLLDRYVVPGSRLWTANLASHAYRRLCDVISEHDLGAMACAGHEENIRAQGLINQGVWEPLKQIEKRSSQPDQRLIRAIETVEGIRKAIVDESNPPRRAQRVREAEQLSKESVGRYLHDLAQEERNQLVDYS